MIREFSATNFRSINDTQTISFVKKSPYKLGEGTHYVTMPDGTDLLRFIALYGPNASGKSNIIKAFVFIINFLISKNKRNFKEPIDGVSLFKFGKDSSFSSFAIDFYIPDGKGSQVRYIYELELNEVFVKRESILYYSSQKPTKIFDRNQKDEKSETTIQFGTGFKVS
ncbi:MAG: AAA family ATPase, partial [Bacteroidales bacterium]|nr:AAA family ATPase [Bacteroidales bacterium]